MEVWDGFEIDALGVWGRFKDLVKQRNTTMEWAAKSASVPFPTLASWIARGTLPRVDAAYRLSNVLGVTVEFFLTGKDSVNQWSIDNRDLLAWLGMLPPDKLMGIKIMVEALALSEISRPGTSNQT